MDNNSLIPKTPDTLAVNLNALCRNSIELIQHARKIAVNQVNLVQLMLERGMVPDVSTYRSVFCTEGGDAPWMLDQAG